MNPDQLAQIPSVETKFGTYYKLSDINRYINHIASAKRELLWNATVTPLNKLSNELHHIHAELHSKLIDLGYRYDGKTNEFYKCVGIKNV